MGHSTEETGLGPIILRGAFNHARFPLARLQYFAKFFTDHLRCVVYSFSQTAPTHVRARQALLHLTLVVSARCENEAGRTEEICMSACLTGLVFSNINFNPELLGSCTRCDVFKHEIRFHV